MSEDLTDYLLEMGFKVRYLHSEVDTLERIQIIRDLRLGEYDVLVGVNLLREGLDLPEVSLVAILDADKEGFLRGETSLIQTIGRAARNVDGTVIMYADKRDRGDAGARSRRPTAAARSSSPTTRSTASRPRRSSRASATSPSSCRPRARRPRAAGAASARRSRPTGCPLERAREDDRRARGGDARRGRGPALRVRRAAARRDPRAAPRARHGGGSAGRSLRHPPVNVLHDAVGLVRAQAPRPAVAARRATPTRSSSARSCSSRRRWPGWSRASRRWLARWPTPAPGRRPGRRRAARVGRAGLQPAGAAPARGLRGRGARRLARGPARLPGIGPYTAAAVGAFAFGDELARSTPNVAAR